MLHLFKDLPDMKQIKYRKPQQNHFGVGHTNIIIVYYTIGWHYQIRVEAVVVVLVVVVSK